MSHGAMALLSFVLFAGGGIIGWLAAGFGIERKLAECCACCTCETCTAADEFGQSVMLDGSTPLWDEQEASRDTGPARPTPAFGARRTVVLEPGPTIYPQLAELADVPRPEPSPNVRGPGHHTGPLWLEAALMGIEARYPIPGTPQWDARHLQEAA